MKKIYEVRKRIEIRLKDGSVRGFNVGWEDFDFYGERKTLEEIVVSLSGAEIDDIEEEYPELWKLLDYQEDYSFLQMLKLLFVDVPPNKRLGYCFGYNRNRYKYMPENIEKIVYKKSFVPSRFGNIGDKSMKTLSSQFDARTMIEILHDLEKDYQTALIEISE